MNNGSLVINDKQVQVADEDNKNNFNQENTDNNTNDSTETQNKSQTNINNNNSNNDKKEETSEKDNTDKESADYKLNRISQQNQRINLYTTNVPHIAYQTANINPYFKERYYKNNVEELKESEKELKHRHDMWNYMMNVSMQNAVIQMRKIA